ncbi:MAG: VWA domain-containing protein [Holophagales bacterium]|nr:VWA domain-containing protein [Holophagales bacterium]MBK9964792.1 VWA domain-containing protein [Holophagales bacterium]
MDAALSWLYGRDKALLDRDVKRTGGLGASTLSVPEWIQEVHRLFPKETIERLEQDAVERYQIHEVVTNPAVLQRVEPNEVLLQAVLRTKHLMNPEVLALARKLVAEVVRRLMEKLAREVRQSFGGALDRRRPSSLKNARNLDVRRTLRSNLKHWSAGERKLFLERIHFFSRIRRFSERWQIVLLVDQSGSMLSSVIHSAVTAACLTGLPGMKTHLVVFDTEVVDLTDHATDPVELLMKVQLGGGTDIAKAVAYAADLLDVPRRSLVILVTDFYEGGSPGLLVRRVRGLVEQGTTVLGLAALDDEARPSYDKELARRLVEAGAHVGAMTPGQLATWIAEKVRR